VSVPGAARLRRTVDVREGEAAALLWSCLYHFFVLSAYYVLRPIRDEMGVAGGVENLAWLFTGTLLGMLLVHPLYTALVARLPRRRFVPLAYRFFTLNLLLFFLVLRGADAAQGIWVGRAFFVWTSVFNLFVVAVFWSFMADLYRPAQSKRLFGIVAVGGTLGAVLGAAITSTLVGALGPVNLLLVSALLLECATRASGALEREEGRLAAEALREQQPSAPPAAEGRGGEVIGGGVFEGVRHVLAMPYLLAIAALMLLFTVASTFLYFQQAAIVAEVFADDREGRTRLFATIDLLVNALTLASQLFLTGRVLRWFGVGFALAFLPVVTLVGFGILAVAPVLGVVVAFQVLRRAGHFGIERPAREVLYTVLPRTDKYKAKHFNDTFVYRLGDQVGAWSYTGMAWLGLGLSGLAAAMLPVSLVWLGLAVWLGRRHVERVRHAASAEPPSTRAR
jgi:ATP:ADP antiporter, AAA family